MAAFQIASVFSDHMVLQREKPIRVFGWGEDGDTVTVTMAGRSQHTKVEGDRWEVLMPAFDAAESMEMTVASATGAGRTFYDIAIGEVWLAGGQSNMELEIHTMYRGEEILNEVNPINDRIRFYYTQKNAFMDEQFYAGERNSGWNTFSKDGARAWSAVGYLFARQLAEKFPGVTIGIIGCNWGGTSASCWMTEEALRDDRDTISYVNEYYQAIEGKSEEEQIREYHEYEEYDRAWNERQMKVYETLPGATWDDVLRIAGECKWPGPMNIMNPFRPAGLYTCMIDRVKPYTLRGFIYYQGESDDHKPQMYYKLFTRLIQEWRKYWKDDELPFLMVQLPAHRYSADPDYKHWPIIREAQMKAFENIRNTGIAVIMDCGEFSEIHPKNKFPVAERLALQAFYGVYGILEAKDAFGPLYNGTVLQTEDGGLELGFNYAADGFDIRHDMDVRRNAGMAEEDQSLSFEVAGRDKEYFPADSVKLEAGKITIYSSKVADPVYARYCWTNYGEAPIYGRNGLPLAPFRTCTEDERVVKETVKVDIQQKMEL